MKWPSHSLTRDDKHLYGHFHQVTVYSGLVCHQHCDIASIPSKRRWHGPYLLAGHKTREKQKIKIISWSWILSWKQQKPNFSRVLCITNQVTGCSKHVSKHCYTCSASFAKDLQGALSKPSKTLHSLLEASLEHLSSSIWLQATVMQWI